MFDPDTHHEATELFSSISYFSHVDTSTLDLITQAAKRRSFDTDQVVLLEGEPSVGLFVVQEGWLKSVKGTVEGREQVVRVVGPGEVFNAIGVLASEVNPGTVVALEPAVVWIIERNSLLQLLEEYSSLTWAVIQALAERVQRLMNQVEDLSLRTVESRVARLLVEEATDLFLIRRQWETQAELAARLGTVPDVLNRTLRKFAEQGLIKVDRQRIQILEKERLSLIAGLEM
jgi:CRP/FNR family transcriptional regulator